MHLLHVLLLLRLHLFPLYRLASQQLYSFGCYYAVSDCDGLCFYDWTFDFVSEEFAKMVSLVVNDNGNEADVILLDLKFLRLTVLIYVLRLMNDAEPVPLIALLVIHFQCKPDSVNNFFLRFAELQVIVTWSRIWRVTCDKLLYTFTFYCEVLWRTGLLKRTFFLIEKFSSNLFNACWYSVPVPVSFSKTFCVTGLALCKSNARLKLLLVISEAYRKYSIPLFHFVHRCVMDASSSCEWNGRVCW